VLQNLAISGPHWVLWARRALACCQFYCGLPLPQSHPGIIHSHEGIPLACFDIHAKLRVGLDALVIDRYSVKQTRTGTKI